MLLSQSFLSTVVVSAVGAQPLMSTTVTSDRSLMGETSGLPLESSRVRKPAYLFWSRIGVEKSM